MRKIFYGRIFFVLVIATLIGIGFILNNPHVGTDDEKSYTVLVLETHLGMTDETKIHLKEAAIEFASRLTNKNDNNYIAVINYLGSTEVLCNFSNNLEEVTTAINKHEESYGYNKNMYAALQKAKDLLNTNNIPTSSAKNIILVTSGISNLGASSETGKYSIMDSADYQYANEIYDLAEEIKADTNIYTIAFYSPTDYPHYNPFFIRRFLNDISSSSEDYYELVNSSGENEFKYIFNNIANNIVKMHIVFIHGIAGSEIEDADGKKLWFDIWDFWEKTIIKMELDEYGDSVNDVRVVTSGYGTNNSGEDIIQALESEYGSDNVHYFAYDWRLDNGINAVKLNEFIDELGVGQVDIVAHSMGGIVASRFIADGNKDKIRKLVTLGTPYLGSPKVPYVFATGRLIEVGPFNTGIAYNGIKKIAPHMTSAYQLLPYKNTSSYIGVEDGWIIKKIQDVPVAGTHDYIKNELLMYGTNGNPISSSVKGNFLNKSIPFMESIYPNGDAAIKSVDYHIIVGDNKQTIATTVFDSEGEHAKNLYFSNGDGTVPFWSATINDTIPETRLSSFDETHMGLVENEDVLAKVIDILNDKSQGSYKPLKLSWYYKLRIACPVDVTVTHNGQILSSSEDSYNGETDFGALYILGENDEIKILTLSADNIYDINLIGTGIGTMDYSVEYYDSSDNLIEETLFSAVNITDDTRITTKINDGKQITLSVDEDNNGSIDNIIYPDKDTHTLTLTAGLGGSISAGTSGDYESDSKINITAVPITGYSFKKWSSSNGGSFMNENSSTTVFTMPDNSTTVTAHFEYIGTSNGGNSGSNGSDANGNSGTNNNSESGANSNTNNGTSNNTGNGNNNYYSGKIAESVTSFIDNTPSINETVSDGDKQTSAIEIEQIKNPFNDVFDADWFFEDVLYAYHNKLMLGTSENPMLFSPNTPLTRGMIVTILYRYIGEPSVKGFKNPFDDISTDAWYADAVIWAASSGIVSGYGDGQFGADANITRQDLAVILNNYIKYEKLNFSIVREYTYFNDNNDIADYAKNSVEHFYKYGFISGKPDNLFDPTGQATRAEVSAILHRFIESAKKY